ncbi:MAG: FtsB family cell division protein [Mycobacteriales bacterium]
MASPRSGTNRRADSARPASNRSARDSHPRTNGGAKAARPLAQPKAAKPSKGVERRLTRRAAILAVVVAILVLSLAYPAKEYLSQRNQIQQNRENQVTRQQRIRDLQERKNRWNDDDYIREQARRRLQYVRPGELTYVVEDGDPGSNGPAGRPADPKSRSERAWYDQLWSGLQHAK